MEPEKRIVGEPSYLIRQAARAALKGRMPLAIASAVVYMLCLTIPVLIVEQITGLWDTLEAAVDSYYAELMSNPTPASIYEWAFSYPYQQGISAATFLFYLIVPGPLTLGVSIIWLRMVRGQEAFADMVFSGFGNFLRSMLLGFIRSFFMALWAILFVIPGVIAYYRYSVAFFLLADNPTMSPFTAMALSKYYMRGNKANRFVLDLSFIGWVIASAFLLSLASSLVSDIILNAGYTITLFISQLVMCVLGAVIFGPVFAYRCVAAAEYYHRVTCTDPASINDSLKLTVD